MKKIIVFFLIYRLFLSANVNFAQAPNLSTASGFAIFTAVGAFDNVGLTNIIGDVGTNAGAFNAFPPGTLVGQKHVADAASALAATDVATVYDELSGIECGDNIASELGNLTLTPNIYCVGTASTLNGDLTLDGQGDPNAIFIFKIDGAFSISASSNVLLTNSTSFHNVYWQITGNFSLGANSFFRGSIISAGAISLLNGSSLEGRGLSSGGAVSLDNNNIEQPLPIELVRFKVISINDIIQINWTTASETNNNYFTIEKTTDGENFTEVARIIGMGNSNTMIHYSSIDHNPYSGVSYYRLKQTDYDGKFTYSILMAIDFIYMIANNFLLYPNLFDTEITIMINDTSQINIAELNIYNALGTKVMNIKLTKQENNFTTSNLPTGNYLFRILSKNKMIQSGKLVSQNK